MGPVEIIKRIDELVSKGDDVLKTTDSIFVDGPTFLGWRTLCLSFLEKLVGKEHVYYRNFSDYANIKKNGCVEVGKSILQAFKDEVKSGWFDSIKKLVSAEIFTDFLDMADYLLSQNYKDAAAVMIGSVLEEHLRQLCAKHNVSVTTTKMNGDVVPKKADQMNNDLYSTAGVYNILDQKNVLSWLDLRNKAAHGQYGDYTIDQVKNMSKGVLEFIARITI